MTGHLDDTNTVIFLNWRQSGAPGWIEARTGCGSIDFIDGAEWIGGGGALGAPNLYLIRQAAEGGGCISWSVRGVEYATGGNYDIEIKASLLSFLLTPFCFLICSHLVAIMDRYLAIRDPATTEDQSVVPDLP